MRRKMAWGGASKPTAPSETGYGACLWFCLLWEEFVRILGSGDGYILEVEQEHRQLRRCRGVGRW